MRVNSEGGVNTPDNMCTMVHRPRSYSGGVTLTAESRRMVSAKSAEMRRSAVNVSDGGPSVLVVHAEEVPRRSAGRMGYSEVSERLQTRQQSPCLILVGGSAP